MDIFPYIDFDPNHEWLSKEYKGKERSLKTSPQNWQPSMEDRKRWSNVLLTHQKQQCHQTVCQQCYFTGCTINENSCCCNNFQTNFAVFQITNSTAFFQDKLLQLWQNAAATGLCRDCTANCHKLIFDILQCVPGTALWYFPLL